MMTGVMVMVMVMVMVSVTVTGAGKAFEKQVGEDNMQMLKDRYDTEK
jgi:hypothetical protein